MPGAFEFASGEVDGALDVAHVTILQAAGSRSIEQSVGVSEVVSWNRTPSSAMPPEDLEQGEIGLRDSLEEPVFLEEFIILRMTHIGEVRMQHER